MKTDNTPTKYFIYCRKSTEDEDRQVLSLDSQEKELKEIAVRNGSKVVATFRESKSAKAPGREIFNDMVARIQRGEADGILCWKLDRLARNPVDEGTVKWLLQSSIVKQITTHEREYTPDDNVLLTSFEFGIATQFVRDLSKNVKRGLKAKLEMGWYPSRAPLGYLNTDDDKQKGRNEIIKDPERFDMVKQIWQMMLTGNYTPPQILEIANKEWKLKTRPTKKYPGLKSLSRSHIYRLLTNPFYYGYFEYGRPKQLYKGNHAPMITEGEFDRVQKLLGKKGRPRAKEKRFAFTGLMRCSNCGAMITAEEKIKRQKNGNVHHYVYYRCTKRKDTNCPEKTVELGELNRQIDSAIGQFTISDKFEKWAIKYLHEVRQSEAIGQEAVLENKQKVAAHLTRQLDALFLKYTSLENADGQLISDEEYLARKTQLTKEKEGAERDLQAQNKHIADWLELSERTFRFARYARMWFAQGDLETRRAIFNCLGSHLWLGDQKIRVEWRKVFSSIIEGLPQAEKELAQVRTSENVDIEGRISAFASDYPTVRCAFEKIRTDFAQNL